MALPAAATCYITDAVPVVARGISLSEEQVDAVLAGPVKDILQDTSGNAELHSLLASIATTDFEQQGLKSLLVKESTPEDWLVGEAIAESYVAEYGSCVFPWPTSRDLKNPEASPTGADLTGFQRLDDVNLPYRFAFGEVKTSFEEKYPPQVMYGRTGLKNQLEGLRDSDLVKGSLVKYLGFHAVNALWCEMFRSAAKRYLSSGSSDIAIFGVLIRDVVPNNNDLSHRASSLAKDCPANTSIALYAVYLPLKSIVTLSERALLAMGAGSSK